MRCLKKWTFSLLRISLFCFSFLFIISIFSTKLNILDFSKVIDVFNGDVYNNLSQKSVSGYDFYYDCEESENNIKDVIQIIENSSEIPLKMLNLKTVLKPQIRILSKFNSRYSESLGYVYFHNNIITILNKESLEETSNYDVTSKFIELVSHEYTHILINYKLKEKILFPKSIPLWFNEGIAEYVGVNSRNGYIPENFETTVKLSELNDCFDRDPDLFYDQSVVFISYLVRNYGYEVIGNIIDNLRGSNFEEAVKKATNESMNDISLKLYNLSY